MLGQQTHPVHELCCLPTTASRQQPQQLGERGDDAMLKQLLTQLSRVGKVGKG
jgi:hypothetical protein